MRRAAGVTRFPRDREGPELGRAIIAPDPSTQIEYAEGSTKARAGLRRHWGIRVARIIPASVLGARFANDGDRVPEIVFDHRRASGIGDERFPGPPFYLHFVDQSRERPYVVLIHIRKSAYFAQNQIGGR